MVYSRNIYENINFIEFLPSRKLAAKLRKNFNAFFEKAIRGNFLLDNCHTVRC